jgi:hypothetical protein
LPAAHDALTAENGIALFDRFATFDLDSLGASLLDSVLRRMSTVLETARALCHGANDHRVSRAKEVGDL